MRRIFQQLLEDLQRPVVFRWWPRRWRHDRVVFCPRWLGLHYMRYVSHNSIDGERDIGFMWSFLFWRMECIQWS